MAHSAATVRSATTGELETQATKLLITALLVILSIVALVVPGWGISMGSFFGGGNQITLALTAADGSELSDEARTAAESVLEKRVNNLYELGLAYSHDADGNFVVSVPASVDAQTIADSLVGTGHVDFVSQLAVSDADALEQLQNGTEDLTLSADSYTAFMSNANITAAQVYTSGSGSSATYAVQVTLDDEATEAFATTTEELASSYGFIAVVEDGTVIATPYVSQKIESSTITISGGFSRSEAYALAAKLTSGELEATATVAQIASFGAGLGGAAVAIFLAGAFVIAVIAAIVATHFFGVSAWTLGASLIATLLVTLGAMAVLNGFDVLILGRATLIALIAVEACCAIATLLTIQEYVKKRSLGSSVVKSQELAAVSLVKLERIFAFIGVVLVIAAFFVERHMAQVCWVLGAGLLVEFILAFLFKLPVLCVFTSQDRVVASNASDAE